ncbi:MAG: flagellar hook protein FlgE [Clostridia bacterium]
MMRSMFSGVSGLSAHQAKMDVIGNNIANVNTVGFKSGRVTFQEVFSQTIKGAAAPDTASSRGGTNPMQVGLGVSVAAMDTIHTRGSLQRTDNPTDLAIDGDGFFIVKTGDSAPSFTRAGNFGFDKLGNLGTADGMLVQGWMQRKEGSMSEYDTEAPMEGINIYEDDYTGNKRIISAKETTAAKFAGNLDSSFESMKDIDATSVLAVSTDNLATIEGKITTTGAETFSVPYTVYDKLGNDTTITITFVKNQVDNTDPAAPETEWFWYTDITDTSDVPKQGLITFDENGKITSGETDSINVIPDATAGTDTFAVDIDFSKLTQFKADGSVKATDVDGYTTGELVNVSIGSDGIITGIYGNGQMQALGMIGVAYFSNPAGLQKTGNNLYIPTTNSGDFTKGVKPGSEGTGALSPGTLEMSNVDLSKEFTEMITTQRGFQANSRIITTSDEMLQELVNLKR